MVSIFWFRRDLRLEDNTALFHALSENENVIPLFIFDEKIINELEKNDPRITFIYDCLEKINNILSKKGASILCLKGSPVAIWEKLIEENEITSVYVNKDYEPYARERDSEIDNLLRSKGISFKSFKDSVIFEENEILKKDFKPYTVYTPYKNKWLLQFKGIKSTPPLIFGNFHKHIFDFPKLQKLGFNKSKIEVKPYTLNIVKEYETTRDFPSLDGTSYLSPHLRFGTISVRQIIKSLDEKPSTFLNELIWREFFMQILFHYPAVVTNNFRSKYDRIEWRNDEVEFSKWCKGETGYPLVDAGMRQLNETGYMHNRVRMITAGFLCKHLLIDWRWGEAYFASKLLDYELSANNGNWQWAAGTGCDAAPYFRIFNPSEQLKKFDKQLKYVKKWVPEVLTIEYPQPMVDHKLARERALTVFKKGLQDV